MGKKLKWGFKSSKQQKRLEKISYSTSKRNNNNNTNPESQIRPSEQSENPIHNDHDYCVRSPEIEVETQIEHHHAPIHEGSDYWREGRRIVELDVLANALSGCVKCGQPLQLCNATDIANYGLSAILKIPCYNPTCHHVNNVPTGKRHKGVWDANSKLAMAMVHCGMGGTQVNGFLNALNIPAVSNTLLYKREKEIGDALEDVAQCSAEKSFNEEIELTKSASNDDGLTVSVDAGWQKRGSGRSYDSLSGHCSMIGANTGKVLSYSVRSKYCKVCDIASTKGVKPKQHDCRMNWTGSSKAMEQDMVIEMMKSCAEKGEAVDTIIADDDTTTISRIKQSVNPNIKKKSDKNHVKKNIGNALYSLKRNHRKLQNPKVFKYIQRCINYMLAQNQNNPKGVETGLEAISRHPFGDHSLCNASWCSHIENPKQKFTSLPFGKPLKDDLLQEDLRKLMSSYKLHSKKLSQMGSTQSNESFNKIVSSKAPKTNFYSGSASLNRRIASAVAQKNEGQSYMLQVYRKVGVSPGIHTKKMLFMKDKLSKKRRVMISSRKYKQRRLELKNRRSKSNAVSELREGTCYSTGVDLQGSEDITEIPQPRVQPQMENESDAGLPQVIFDLETTGLGRDSHITQIAAACGGEHWQSYVKPKKKYRIWQQRRQESHQRMVNFSIWDHQSLSNL
ncbi:hypothetical protein FSP39_012810 [Pinctada imbricata]|uniref:Mutator-like transposase domain-containing protein n=1 Tax=Pinctada imbricata TaxID=66713 RepID=A0AA89C3Q2_PINIB|nr:hypothetical protein FSP39_012810 [Pinctada imbricata]